jgi:hypothetical protein
MREQPGTVPGPYQDREEPRLQGQDSAAGGRQAGGRALACALTALSDALRRLAAAGAGDMPQAIAAATEAVWWVTTVDAAMTRHHPSAYGRALAGLDPAARRAVEGVLTGLRFVRSQLGYSADPEDFISLPPAAGADPTPEWTWSAVPPPSPQRGKSRDVSPFRQYRTQLAGRPVADALGLAAGFLAQAHAAADPACHRASRAPLNGSGAGH